MKSRWAELGTIIAVVAAVGLVGACTDLGPDDASEVTFAVAPLTTNIDEGIADLGYATSRQRIALLASAASGQIVFSAAVPVGRISDGAVHVYDRTVPAWSSDAPDGAPAGVELFCYAGGTNLPHLVVNAGLRNKPAGSFGVSTGVCPNEVFADRMVMEALSSPADFYAGLNQALVFLDGATGSVTVSATTGELCVTEGTTVDPYTCSSGGTYATNGDGDLTVSVHPVSGFEGCSDLVLGSRLFTLCVFPTASLSFTAQ